jgi:hypothetical protein
MQKAMMLVALLSAGVACAGTVTWQCNMNVQIALNAFTPGVDQVVVRGYFNDWSGTNPTLTDPDNDGIYTGSFNHGAFPVPFYGEYKYVIRYGGTNDSWEFVSNRPYTYLGDDLLLPVEYYNNVTAVPGVCDVEITFQVDMNVQMATGAFNPGAGDIVVVRGGTSPLQWGGTDWTCADQGGGIYAVEVPFAGQAESNAIEHKFVIVAGGDNWESSPNRLAYADCAWPDADADGYKDGVMPVVFFANVGWDNIIDHPVLVTFDVDASRISCWFANGMGDNGGLTSYADMNFISVHGFFNGWPAWDGSINPAYHLAPAGPCRWVGSILFPTGSSKIQIYKYGANGWDNEAGFAQDHSMDLSGDQGTGFLTIYDVFGSNGSNWDCFGGCYETVDARELPSAFALDQNVPNPFNPVTSIAFTLDATAHATLSVHDLSGARVATLVDGLLSGGRHEVSFDASTLASGVYVYSLQSEGRMESRKMVLVK